MEYIHGKNSIIVRFYDEHHSRSVQLNKDWDKFEKMYSNITNITTARVNCGKNLRLCLHETAWDFPIVRLYMNNKVIQYDGGMSYESLSKWAMENTGIQGINLQLDLLSPNNRTFNELLNTQKCVFAMFHTRQCKKCKRFMKSLKDIAITHKGKNISVCEIDIDKFKSFSFDYKIKELPTFYLFKDKKRKIYEGKLEKMNIINFINEKCFLDDENEESQMNY